MQPLLIMKEKLSDSEVEKFGMKDPEVYPFMLLVGRKPRVDISIDKEVSPWTVNSSLT